jgi:putative ABC transport system permease protein
MSIGDSLQVALEALIANKMRAALTMLGIVIGVGAVIALMAVGQGSQKAVTDRIQGLGSNLIFVRPGQANQAGGVRGGFGSAQTLTLEDAEALQANVPQVVNAAPQINGGAQVIAGGSNTFTRVTGVTPEYADVVNLTLASGEFISVDDIDRNARNVVLGSNVAQRLFPDGSDPVGQQLRLNVQRNVITFEIKGVLKPKGGNAQASQDDQIFVPISTAARQIQPQRSGQGNTLVGQITVQVSNKSQIDVAKQAIDQVLRDRHNVATPDFTLESQEDIQAAINEVSQTMTVLLGSIAGISLIVGGIGIMNIMLVSVTERTREIGIRKAVGAQRNDILMQFLTEALTVTIAGGLLGVAAGVGAAQLMNGKDIAGLGENVQTVISWTSVVVAFAVSAGIGIFFGLYPAQRAANLRPIEALRYE